MRNLLLFGLIILSLSSFGQSIQGRVTDSISGQPLAFVNIVYKGTRLGTTTDIDGNFKLRLANGNLEFSFIGYESKTISGPFTDGQDLRIQLAPSNYILSEVIVTPGENPAHRIIRKAVKNKGLHDPMNLPGFQYESYNKFILTANSDSLRLPDTLKTIQDSMAFSLSKFLDERHLFIMESYTRRKYIHPNKDEENILATRVSGLKNPMFSVLATEFQSFSFYPDHIDLLGKSYLSPLSKNSESRYVFQLEDTLLRNQDSIFIISYRPRPKSSIHGLKGLLYIHTDGYALSNLTASPTESSGTEIKINQQYKKVDDHWFPEQLNTDLLFESIEINGQKPLGVARSYIQNIQIGKDSIDPKFSPARVKVNPNSNKIDPDFWNGKRPEDLDEKESSTYVFIDSLGKAENLDQKLFIATSLISNKAPIGKINLLLDRILNYTEHEGLRLGLGFETSPRLWEKAYLKSYAAYGFKDAAMKFGGEFGFRLSAPKQVFGFLTYQNDLHEPGTTENVFQERRLLNPNMRSYNLSGNLVIREEYKLGVKGHLSAHTKFESGLALSNFNPIFESLAENLPLQTAHTAYLKFEYRPNDRKQITDYGMVSLSENYPVYQLRIDQSLPGIAEIKFTRILLRAKFQKRWRGPGKTLIQVKLGRLFGENFYPYSLNPEGNLIGPPPKFSFMSDLSFESLYFSDGTSNTLASSYFIHDFGHVFGKKMFRPRLHAGLLWGENENPVLPLQTDLSKGYLEMGLSLADIFSGLGVGVFYPYTPGEDFFRSKLVSVKLGFEFNF